MTSIVIIDYGMGNIYSLSSAIEYLGLHARLSSQPDAILSADFLIMPGVGSFNLAMRRLRERDLIGPLHRAVVENSTPLLGICLGMQLLGKSGTEDGHAEGLGFIDGVVDRFDPALHDVKIPHVGFSRTLIVDCASPLFRGFPEEVDFYYTHSYRMSCSPECLRASCRNGETFAAAVSTKNIYGTQFHPELSQTNGLRVLKNFFTECR